jgi:hypothetical protein
MREFSSDMPLPAVKRIRERTAAGELRWMERGRGWRTRGSPQTWRLSNLQRPRQVSVFVPRENPSYGNSSRAQLERDLRSIGVCAGGHAHGTCFTSCDLDQSKVELRRAAGLLQALLLVLGVRGGVPDITPTEMTLWPWHTPMPLFSCLLCAGVAHQQ